MDRKIGKTISKNLSSTYSQKTLDQKKQSTKDALQKTQSKKQQNQLVI